MVTLSSFIPEQVESIISLPFRAGLHISYTEDEGGECDDDLETHALEACISEFTKLEGGSNLNKEIASAILVSKDRWAIWEQGVFNIEPLCVNAINALKEHASQDEIKKYIEMVVGVATSVASAYGEFGEENDEPSGFFGKVMGGIVKKISNMSADDINHPMNISAAESSAINRIAQAMKNAL